MVQTVGIFHLYIYIYIYIYIYLVRTLSNCACIKIMRFVLYENIMKYFLPFFLTMSVLMLSRREAYASKREVGETVLYTCDNLGLLFIIPHCSRASVSRLCYTLVCYPLRLLARRVSAMLGRSRSPRMPCIRLLVYSHAAFSAGRTMRHRRLPSDCQQHSALPKTIPTDTASLCVGTRTDDTMRTATYNARRDQLPHIRIALL